MDLKQKLETLLENGMTQEQAFSFFDELESVTLDMMIGSWKGKEAPSSHPMDGLLTQFNWYGKKFISAEEVHPLVFEKENGKLFSVNPGAVLQGTEPDPTAIDAAATDESKARIRMVEYRGKVSATMIYDQLPIHDIFRKIDEDTLFGVMDFKGRLNNLGYFFVLERVK